MNVTSSDIADKLLGELRPGLSADVLQQIVPLSQKLASAGRIVCHGLGREGLMMRALAMRLFHLGCDVHVVGDMTLPPVGKGDLFFVSVGPGHIASIATLIAIAKDAGAEVVCVTAEPDGLGPKSSDHVVVLPAQTMAADQGDKSTSILPMGSLYEVLMLLFFELLVLDLRDRIGISSEAMRANHTNLE